MEIRLEHSVELASDVLTNTQKRVSGSPVIGEKDNQLSNDRSNAQCCLTGQSSNIEDARGLEQQFWLCGLQPLLRID